MCGKMRQISNVSPLEQTVGLMMLVYRAQTFLSYSKSDFIPSHHFSMENSLPGLKRDLLWKWKLSPMGMSSNMTNSYNDLNT